ncbi:MULTISPECIES: GNAT family N-acetyltransferase [Streptomyces]|uniref:GNAT family N-acetyltransferase n=1 Tax=Streptomyces lycii TaxID=2654337 RepID=A0ABQ7FIZ2_9ACTN|nr:MULTISPECIES: GNAT family N-acetyltransferase [Streptomyces]KAF4407938.1 GNAT family N-acetyltransferase [Streptomyces lycii]PGH51339.1 GNAT family N-acetyltransferase [Streptomyces sp. Ru87]
MTTTLRPMGPERHTPDGGRSRGYEVCVNSRPVGSVGLSTDSRLGPGAGRIQGLRIAEQDRRRGRGTVAALAAEEVLRGWGCTRIEITVPASAGAARAMADGLGYTERNRILSKRVPARPPSLPPGSAARAMNATEFEAWLEASKEDYARSWTERGVPEEAARAKSEDDHRRKLPDGVRTSGAVLRVLSHEGRDAGTLWLAVGEGLPEAVDAFVFDVEVDAELRGRGHGRSLMLLAERECRAAGADVLGLNVFTSNTPARRLYESLGYEPVLYGLYKPLA